jgi:hypothetical protein
MIKANELRIGNFVVYDENETDINLWKEVKQISSTHVGTGYRKLLSLDLLFPIRLTPEILEKAGFEKNPHVGWGNISGVYSIDKWWSVAKNEDGWLFGFDDIDEGFVTLTTINHLHQLQNLYFSLTGEELKINM